MPRGPSGCDPLDVSSKREKLSMVTNLFPAFLLLLLGVADASHQAYGTTSSGSSQLRHLSASPLVLTDNIRVFSTLTSPGNRYRNGDSGAAVKRSAHLFFSDRQRANVNGRRTDILQSLEDHLLPWTLRGANQELFSTHAAEAAFERTLYFGDVPHERALETHIAMRREEGLPSLRLGSIRFTSPFFIFS